MSTTRLTNLIGRHAPKRLLQVGAEQHNVDDTVLSDKVVMVQFAQSSTLSIMGVLRCSNHSNMRVERMGRLVSVANLEVQGEDR